MKSWAKVGWSNAEQVLGVIGKPVGDDDGRGLPPDAYFAKLVETGQLERATTFVSHALPRFETIMWAVQALRTRLPEGRSDPIVTEVLRWIDDPTDERRRTIHAMAESAGGSSAQALLGYAVFMSGGSISEPDLPAVLPPVDVCAKLAAAAVLKAAFADADPQMALRDAVSIGDNIARQGAVL